ncbi:MAG: thioredoxin [Thermoflexales bacterium]|nr:thioredoxin [Thermoflexales bacterium]
MGKGPRPEKERPASTHAQAQPGPAAGASEDRPHAATDASFDQDVLHARLPVLVDFWAPGCGPCRAMEPILEKLARELSGRLRVVKVNASQNPYTAQRYGVQGVPTMLVVKDGRVVNRLVGALPEATLRQRLMPWLS